MNLPVRKASPTARCCWLPARGTTVLTNLLDSDDVRHMLNALSALGFNIPCLPTAPAAK